MFPHKLNDGSLVERPGRGRIGLVVRPGSHPTFEQPDGLIGLHQIEFKKRLANSHFESSERFFKIFFPSIVKTAQENLGGDGVQHVHQRSGEEIDCYRIFPSQKAFDLVAADQHGAIIINGPPTG